MKKTAVLAPAIFLFGISIGTASEVQKMTCKYDHRAHDGDAQSLVVEKASTTENGTLYSVKIVDDASPWSPRESIIHETGKTLSFFSCSFSETYKGVFLCTEITPEGFRGIHTLISEISMRGDDAESYRVELLKGTETPQYEEKSIYETYYSLWNEEPDCVLTLK
jgi:hypothetical protein